MAINVVSNAGPLSEREDIWINPSLCIRLLEEIFTS